jgi:hypothetical protein
MSNLTEDKSLREFWARCTDQNLLYIQPEKLVTCLDQKYGEKKKLFNLKTLDEYVPYHQYHEYSFNYEYELMLGFVMIHVLL